MNGRISSRSYPRYRLAPPVLPPRPRRRRSLLHAERGIGPPHHRDRRRRRARGRHRQPQVRLARVPGIASPDRGRNRVLRYFRIPPIAPGDYRGEHAEGRGGAGPRGVPAHSRAPAEGAADHRAAQAGAVRRGRAARAPRRAGTSRAAASCASTPSRATTSSCSTPSASWRSSTRSRPRCSSAAASSTQGGHNILEPAVFGKPIVFGPLHAELRRDRARRSSTTARRSRCTSGRELEDALLELLAIRSGAPASARRRARWSRRTAARATKTMDGDRARAARRRARQRVRPFGWSTDVAADFTRAAARAPPPLLRRRSRNAQRRSASAGHQRRQSRRRRPRQDAARRAASRASCSRRGERPAILSRGYGAHATRRTASSSCATRTAIRADLGARRRRAADARAPARRAACSSAPTGISPAGSRSSTSAAPSTCSTTGFSTCALTRRRPRVVAPRRPRATGDAAGRAAARAARRAARPRRDRRARRGRRGDARRTRRAGVLGGSVERARVGEPLGRAWSAPADGRSWRVAGIARPTRSSTISERRAGRRARRWRSAITIAYPPRDVGAHRRGSARRQGARVIVTTEKDSCGCCRSGRFRCRRRTCRYDDRADRVRRRGVRRAGSRRRLDRVAADAASTRSGLRRAAPPRVLAVVARASRRRSRCCRCAPCSRPAPLLGRAFYAVDRGASPARAREPRRGVSAALRRRSAGRSRARCSRTSAGC